MSKMLFQNSQKASGQKLNINPELYRTNVGDIYPYLFITKSFFPTTSDEKRLQITGISITNQVDIKFEL